MKETIVQNIIQKDTPIVFLPTRSPGRNLIEVKDGCGYAHRQLINNSTFENEQDI
jgi:hypothetical protein